MSVKRKEQTIQKSRNGKQAPIVYFASTAVKKLEAGATLPAKFERLLKRFMPKEGWDKKRIAIKMHVGGGIGYTTIHPIFVIELVKALKERGANPFITDGSFSVSGARIRGYTEEVLGVPIIPVAGVNDKYFYEKEVGYKTLKTIQLCGNIVDADGLVVLSHGKGHGHSGFGGAIKNIAMGCVTCKTRGDIHRLSSRYFTINADLCKQCLTCIKNCPTAAINYSKDKKVVEIFDHHCRFCMHCVECCPQNAITIDMSGFRDFQHGMALAVRETIRSLADKPVTYINILTGITPLCDCWGFSTASLVPDIGIFASNDIAAIEKASLDSIKAENFIKGSLPGHFKLSGKGHLFQQIHGKNPYIQVEEIEKLGIGKADYKLVEIF
jgi:uncharacterized protein